MKSLSVDAGSSSTCDPQVVFDFLEGGVFEDVVEGDDDPVGEEAVHLDARRHQVVPVQLSGRRSHHLFFVVFLHNNYWAQKAFVYTALCCITSQSQGTTQRSL